jgi:membrane protein required for colicin V production
MNWLDIAVLVVLIIAVVAGLKVGIIKALLTVVGGIIGVVLAGRFSASLGEKMGFISNEGVAKVVAFIIILIVVLLIAALAAGFLKKVAETILLGWVNRLGGAVLGLILGAIFCGAILAMWVKFQGISDTLLDSALASFLLDKFPVVMGLLPSEFDSVRDFFR